MKMQPHRSWHPGSAADPHPPALPQPSSLPLTSPSSSPVPPLLLCTGSASARTQLWFHPAGTAARLPASSRSTLPAQAAADCSLPACPTAISLLSASSSRFLPPAFLHTSSKPSAPPDFSSSASPGLALVCCFGSAWGKEVLQALPAWAGFKVAGGQSPGLWAFSSEAQGALTSRVL